MTNLDDLSKLLRDPNDEEEEDVCNIKAHDTARAPDDDTGDFCGAGDDEPSTIEEDLTEALDYMEQLLMMMESITVSHGKIQRIPKGMTDLMEEVSEFLDQWEIGKEKE